MTWTLSVDVFQLRVSPLWVTLEAASPLGVEGGCVSVGGDGDGPGLRTSQRFGVPTSGSPKTALVHSTPSVNVRGAVYVPFSP